MARRLCRAMSNIMEASSIRWEALRHELSALNPASVLDRGFSLVRTPGGEIVRDARHVAVSDNLEITLSSGMLGCRVETVHPDAEKLKVPGLPGRLHPPRAERKSGRNK